MSDRGHHEPNTSSHELSNSERTIGAIVVLVVKAVVVVRAALEILIVLLILIIDGGELRDGCKDER